MKRIATVVAALLLCSSAIGQNSQRERLEQHLYTLASDSLRGRQAGTEDAVKAAHYITTQWNQMGLEGQWRTLPFDVMGKDGYFDYYFKIEGSDPVLKDEYIVVGAHYDHVGVKNDKVYNGADDNASGSSCLIEIARQLLAKRGQMKRSVYICAFDAEEMGLYGSKAFVSYLKANGLTDRVKLMMSVDMVGWYKANESLILEGIGTLADGRELTDPSALGVDIKIHPRSFENSLFTATDTEPFAKEGIPTLAVTTGLKSPYHKPEDDADLIDYDGLSLIADYISTLTVAAANRNGELASGKVASKHRSSRSRFGVGMSLGYNSSHLVFPDATVIGKSKAGFTGGLMLQYYFSRDFGIHADVLYTYTQSPYLDVNNPFGAGYNIYQQSLTVPLMVQWCPELLMKMYYFNLGGFYSRVFDGGFFGRKSTSGGPAYSASENQWGIAWGFGLRLGYHWQMDFSYLYQLNDLFDTSTGLPKARKDIFSLTLGYYF